MALAVYIPFPEDDSNSTNHDLVSSIFTFIFKLSFKYLKCFLNLLRWPLKVKKNCLFSQVKKVNQHLNIKCITLIVRSDRHILVSETIRCISRKMVIGFIGGCCLILHALCCVSAFCSFISVCHMNF